MEDIILVFGTLLMLFIQDVQSGLFQDSYETSEYEDLWKIVAAVIVFLTLFIWFFIWVGCLLDVVISRSIAVGCAH